MFGFGNTGNDATLEVTLAEIGRCLPDARFTVVASAPDKVSSAFGVRCVPIRYEPPRQWRFLGPVGKLTREWARWDEARALLRTADCLLVPGTGILDDFSATVFGHAYQLWKWCAAARQVGTPVKLVSVGAGPVERGWSRRLFRLTARVADHRSYRDEGSFAFTREVLQIDTSNDRITPDLAFGLDVDAPPLFSAVETVGVGVMNYHNWLDSKEAPDVYEAYMSKLADFGCALLKQGKKIRVLVGDSGDAAAAADLRARLLKGAPERASAVSQGETASLRALCADIAKTDAVVATRYHTIVGALMCGRPAVSIGYADKNRAVMEVFGVGALCQNIWSYELDMLHSQFAAATADVAQTNKDFRAVAERLRRQVREHFASVAQEIAKHVEMKP